MAPKLYIKPKLEINFLLSYQYDPADYNLTAFYEHYQRLVKHRDDLRKQCDDKEEKRASLKQADGKSLNRDMSRDLLTIL